MYISVRTKFIAACVISFSWFVFSTYVSMPWIKDLSHYTGYFFAIFSISFIALIPGFMYMFLTLCFVFDRRVSPKELKNYPPISVIICAYNEEKMITETINALINQNYKGIMEIIVVDDGSTDKTVYILENLKLSNLRIIRNQHGGKANCLNTALKYATHEYLICLDADTLVWQDAVKNIVERLFSDPKGTAAIAGSIYARNARESLMARIQEWDYFLAIAAIKRMQSLLQGTLVAQGAFSLYVKKYVLEVGGWENTLGEDIVISWALLTKQYRIGFADEAIAFTTVPYSYKGFYLQRKRWARGLIEAFKHHPKSLITPRYTLLLVYWNLLFPIIDMVYFFIFIPGVILALFGYFFIAGPMTIALVSLSVAYNTIFIVTQHKVFSRAHLSIRKNLTGLILYVLFYQFLMVPACIAGYFSEILSLRKRWSR